MTAELSKRAEQAKQVTQAGADQAASTTLSQHALELSTASLTNGDSTHTHAETATDAATSTEQAAHEQPAAKSYAEAVKEPADLITLSAHPEAIPTTEPEAPADTRTKAELWQAVKILSAQRNVSSLLY